MTKTSTQFGISDVLKLHLSRHPGRFFVLVLLYLVENLAEAIGLSLVVPMFNMVTSSGQSDSVFTRTAQEFFAILGIPFEIVPVLILLSAAFLLKALFILFARLFVAHTAKNFLFEVQQKLLLGYAGAQVLYSKKVDHGHMLNISTEEAKKASVCLIWSAMLVSTIMAMILYVGLALVISGWLTLVALLASGISFAPAKLFMIYSGKYGEKAVQANMNLNSRLMATLRIIKDARSMAQEGRLLKRTGEALSQYSKAWFAIQFLSSSVASILQPLAVVVLCLILYLSIRMEIELGEIVVFLIAFQRLLPTYSSAQNLRNNLLISLPGLARVLQTIAELETHRERRTGTPMKRFERGIELTNVHFSYEGSKILDDINLTIPKGKMVAVLGRSGAGKSTLVDILLGFLEPDHGEVLVDGRPLQEIDLLSWRKRIGFVPQETTLLPDSIRDNIGLYSEFGDQSRIEEAARKAMADEFISSLEDGYGTLLTQHGTNLSGGQRQRLALGRALYKYPEFLILDEATSGLDPETQSRVMNMLLDACTGNDQTILIITHRISSLKGVDLIYVLEDGRITEQGSYVELANRAGGFLQRQLDAE